MKTKTAEKLKQEAHDRYAVGKITLGELKTAVFNLNELVLKTLLAER